MTNSFLRFQKTVGLCGRRPPQVLRGGTRPPAHSHCPHAGTHVFPWQSHAAHILSVHAGRSKTIHIIISYFRVFFKSRESFHAMLNFMGINDKMKNTFRRRPYESCRAVYSEQAAPILIYFRRERWHWFSVLQKVPA